MSLYEIEDVVKKYPGQEYPANNHISLSIEAGEIFGMLGDNGAGKSTLVRQMVNLLKSTSGEIRFMGRPVQADPLSLSMMVGYMPQESLALNNMTVGESLYFTANLRGLDRAAALRERDRLMDLWQIDELCNKFSSRLSGGQRRLLRLAVSMAARPPMLILDEPTNDLDPQRRKLVWDILRKVNQEEGVTLFFITHDAIEAEKVIQRVGILNQGELVAMGRPADLKKEIDQKLRLELFFSAKKSPVLSPGLAVRRLDADRWVVLLNRSDVQTVLTDALLEQVDDFRLYSATLEDLYLHYATNHTAHKEAG